GDRAMVQTLLMAGADANASDQTFGSALYAAAYTRHTGITRRLFEHGASLHRRGYFGTPFSRLPHAKGMEPTWGHCLLYASEDGHEHVVQLLLTRNVIDVQRRKCYRTDRPRTLRHGTTTAVSRGCYWGGPTCNLTSEVIRVIPP
ncbi:hypothetical protein B0H67DRAFT_483069, partial [Lasiosphaeris hirsuta]